MNTSIFPLMNKTETDSIIYSDFAIILEKLLENVFLSAQEENSVFNPI